MFYKAVYEVKTRECRRGGRLGRASPRKASVARMSEAISGHPTLKVPHIASLMRATYWPHPVHVLYNNRMKTEDALAILRRNEGDLRARGVRRAALFGSVARGDNRPDSDIDIMIEIEPAARITVYDYVGLKEYIASLFDGPVDVVSRDNLKPYVRPAATADATYAF